MPIAKGDLFELVNKVPSLEQWELDNLYIQGMDCFKRREWKEAIACFLGILRWEPDYKNVVYGKLKEARRKEKIEDFFVRGIAHCTEGAWQKAEEMFSKVLELELGHKPAVVEQAYARGMVHFDKKQLEKALEQFKLVIKLDATRQDAIDKLRETSLLLVSGFPEKRLEDAIKLLEQVRSFVKDDVSLNTKLKELKKQNRLKTLYEKGMDYFRAGRLQEAYDKFTSVYKIDQTYHNVDTFLKEIEERLESSAGEPRKFSEWIHKRWKIITVLGAIISAVLTFIVLPVLTAEDNTPLGMMRDKVIAYFSGAPTPIPRSIVETELIVNGVTVTQPNYVTGARQISIEARVRDTDGKPISDDEISCQWTFDPPLPEQAIGERGGCKRSYQAPENLGSQRVKVVVQGKDSTEIAGMSVRSIYIILQR